MPEDGGTQTNIPCARRVESRLALSKSATLCNDTAIVRVEFGLWEARGGVISGEKKDCKRAPVLSLCCPGERKLQNTRVFLGWLAVGEGDAINTETHLSYMIDT